ncbi:hypothetical protein C8R44DRAFT_750324 [Mycena epipterygia]|nr:hypothetical protein C8R44DRAFT_750324 [Mycena epipterygia]
MSGSVDGLRLNGQASMRRREREATGSRPKGSLSSSRVKRRERGRSGVWWWEKKRDVSAIDIVRERLIKPRGEGGEALTAEKGYPRGGAALVVLALCVGQGFPHFLLAGVESFDQGTGANKTRPESCVWQTGGQLVEDQDEDQFVADEDDEEEEPRSRKKARRVVKAVPAMQPKKRKGKAAERPARARKVSVSPAGSDIDDVGDEVHEYDLYSPLAYATKGLLTNQRPRIHRVLIRFDGSFDFASLRIASEIQVVAARGQPRLLFERYCVFARDFKPEDLKPINLTERGDFMLYSDAAFTDARCPGIQGWKTKVENSATYKCHNNADDSGDDVEIVSASFPQPPSSAQPGPSSGSGSSQNTSPTTGAGASGSGSSQYSSPIGADKPIVANARKRPRAEFVQGSSRPHIISKYLERESRFLERDGEYSE